MRQLKYLKKLELFIDIPLFTSADAEKQGIPRHALAYLVKKGILERIYPGAYRFSQYEPKVEFQWENLALLRLVNITSTFSIENVVLSMHFAILAKKLP